MTDLAAFTVEELAEKVRAIHLTFALASAVDDAVLSVAFDAALFELVLRAATRREMADFADLRTMRADVAEARSRADEAEVLAAEWKEKAYRWQSESEGARVRAEALAARYRVALEEIDADCRRLSEDEWPALSEIHRLARTALDTEETP